MKKIAIFIMFFLAIFSLNFNSVKAQEKIYPEGLPMPNAMPFNMSLIPPPPIENELITAPAKIEEFGNMKLVKNYWLFQLFLWLGIMAALFFLAFMIVIALKKRRNPNNYLACGPNLSLESDGGIIDYFRRLLKPGEELVDFERGFVRPIQGEDDSQVLVKMKFGDGKTHKVWLKKGEEVIRVIIREKNGRNRSELYRSTGANGFTYDGQMHLPATWEFVSYVSRTNLTERIKTEAKVKPEDNPELSLTELLKIEQWVSRELESEISEMDELIKLSSVIKKIIKLQANIAINLKIGEDQTWKLKLRAGKIATSNMKK